MNNIDEQGFIIQRRLPDQRLLAVQPLLFGQAQLGIGPRPPRQDAEVFDDIWDFLSVQAALDACTTWNPQKAAEPDGWHRHPQTGRYRIGGRADLEYIKSDAGEAVDQVKHAIAVLYGSDREIVEVHEETENLNTSLPHGTRHFVAVLERSTCDHEPRCQWFDQVFHYLDRCVVVSLEDAEHITVANVAQRLTDTYTTTTKRITEATEAFWYMVETGKALVENHIQYEQAVPYPLEKRWMPGIPPSYHVTKMKLSADRTALTVNESLTLHGIPPMVFAYVLGPRSALEWIIDQYQVSTDERSGIVSDPNRADDEEYIVRLVCQVVTVSVETVRLVNDLAASVNLDDFELVGADFDQEKPLHDYWR